MKTNLICYCFGYSQEDIMADVENNRGVSTIHQRILGEKKKGTCNCKFNHPEGR